MTQAAPAQVLAPPNPISSLLLAVGDQAGLEQDDIQALRMITRFGKANDPSAWQIGRPVPGPDAEVYLVAAMFVGSQGERGTSDSHVPGELRMYCIPRFARYPATKEEPEGGEVPYVCYVITPANVYGVPRVETMNRDAFVDDLAYEFKQLAILRDILDEGEECPNPACDAVYDPDDDPKFCSECGTKFPEEPAEEPEGAEQGNLPA